MISRAISGNRKRLEAGARVCCRAGPAKGHCGTVVARPQADGRKGIHPHGDRTRVFVLFDGMGTAMLAPTAAIERVRLDREVG
jgi:hypothetical protein